jgi:hypothetical protein
MKNGHFARHYLERARELLADGGLLGEASVVAVWDSLYHTIDKAIYAEAARWGDYRRDVHRWQSAGQLYTVDDHYMEERNRLLTQYFPARSARVLKDITSFAGPVGIKEAEMGYADNRWYSLSGQQKAQPTKPGIYIVNGRKRVVRF